MKTIEQQRAEQRETLRSAYWEYIDLGYEHLVAIIKVAITWDVSRATVEEALS